MGMLAMDTNTKGSTRLRSDEVAAARRCLEWRIKVLKYVMAAYCAILLVSATCLWFHGDKTVAAVLASTAVATAVMVTINHLCLSCLIAVGMSFALVGSVSADISGLVTSMAGFIAGLVSAEIFHRFRGHYDTQLSKLKSRTK